MHVENWNRMQNAADLGGGILVGPQGFWRSGETIYFQGAGEHW